MRRSFLTAVGIMALVLAVPSAALADHGRRHHHHHHGAGAKTHHAKFRIVHIGSPAAAPTKPPTPGTTPPTPPAPEDAGTVASYTGGLVTLTLNDGSTVSGKVTIDTRIRCVKATPTPPVGGPSDEGPGDDNGQGDDQQRGDMSQSGQGKDGWWHGDHGSDDDQDVQGPPEPPCDSSSLVTGAIVRFAELRIGPRGTEFESILLVR